MRGAVLGAVLAAALGGPASAQDAAASAGAETLADIRQQLAVLNVEMKTLTRELSTTGAPALGIEGTSFPDRVVSLERQLQSLTTQVERLQFRVESVARDGGNRIEDLRFQLCELTTDCDLAALPEPGALGGAVEGVAPQGAVDTAASGDATAGAQLAVGEQADFDAARARMDADPAAAAEAFAAFVQTYPGSPLATEAQFLRGEALTRTGAHAGAARAYLDAFSAGPDGSRAPEALLGLGRSLGTLGQTDEACLTLSELPIRFPGSAAARDGAAARAELGCS